MPTNRCPTTRRERTPMQKTTVSLSRQIALALAIASGAPLAAAVDKAATTRQGEATTLDEIVVTATRTEQALLKTPASVTVRDMDELRRDGFTVGSDEFRGVPGVFFRRGEGDADEFPFVSFRGSIGTEGSLSLIDGIPLVGLYEETQLNEIPYDAVERIEIVKGPVSALYGRGGLYGSTNYFTRSVEDDSLSARVSVGSDRFRRGDFTLTRTIGDGHGVLLSASHEDSEGWREQGERKISNVFGKASFELSPNTALTAYVNFNDRLTELSNGRALDTSGQIVPFDGGDEEFLGFGSPFNDTQNAMAVARLTHAFSDALSVTGTVAYRDIKRDVFLNFFDPFGTDLQRGVIGYNGFRGDTRQRVGFAETTMSWTPEGHEIIAGISVEQSRINEFIRWSGQNGFTPECGFTFYLVEVDAQTGRVLNRNNPCFVVDDPLTSSRFQNDYWGAFVQDRMTIGDRFALTLGARFDSFRRRATFFAIPGTTDGGGAERRCQRVLAESVAQLRHRVGAVVCRLWPRLQLELWRDVRVGSGAVRTTRDQADNARQPRSRRQGSTARPSLDAGSGDLSDETEEPAADHPQSRRRDRLHCAVQPRDLRRQLPGSRRRIGRCASGVGQHPDHRELQLSGSGMEGVRRSDVLRAGGLQRKCPDRRTEVAVRAEHRPGPG